MHRLRKRVCDRRTDKDLSCRVRESPENTTTVADLVRKGSVGRREESLETVSSMRTSPEETGGTDCIVGRVERSANGTKQKIRP